MGNKLELALRDLFSTPDKWMTILLLTVCILIPVVGTMVIAGYAIRRFASARKGLPITDFSFNYFGEYLQIGLWPLLCSMLLGLVTVPLILFCYSPFVLLMIDPESGFLITISLLLSGLLFTGTIVLLTLFTYPVMLKSGLQMNFGAGFSGSFMRDFIKRVGGQVVLWAIILGAISIPLYLVGYMALVVGIYPVAAIITFVSHHLMFQMYDLYLERGGEEIPVADFVYGSVPVSPPSLPPEQP